MILQLQCHSRLVLSAFSLGLKCCLGIDVSVSAAPWYKLKSIVGEDETRYLIDWADDEETGEKFEPSWEPKEHVNAEAVEDYELQKAEKASKYHPPASYMPIDADFHQDWRG